MMEICLSAVILFVLMPVQAQEGILNQSCNNRNDCGVSGYVCGQNKTCQCDRNYIAGRNGDKCVGGIGQKCRYDENCVEGAFCELQQQCKCKENLYPSDDGLACSSTRPLTQPHLYLIGMLILHFLKIV